MKKFLGIILTFVLIIAGAALFSAFEAHIIDLTADLVQIDAPVLSPPGPGSLDITDGGTFTDPVDVYVFEFDTDATHVFYTTGAGTDPGAIPDPVCGDVLGGPKNDPHSLNLSADAVIKAIACDGTDSSSHKSAENIKIYHFNKPNIPCPDGNAAVATHSTHIEGNEITGTFTIAEGCEGIEVSLATYKALTPTFSLPQILSDSDTGTFDAGGPYTLTATIPSCFFQWDFVVGPVIENLESPDHLYGDRKLEWDNGGTDVCPTESE